MKRPILLTTLVLALACSLELSVASSAEQATQQSSARGPDPIVDIDQPPQHDSRPAKVRQARNRRYKTQGRGFQEPQQQEEYLGSISDAQSTLPVFPVKQSDAIIIGTVKNVTAFLAEDKSMVYSEFQIEVSEILRTSGTVSITIGGLVDAERPGGAVRFPSGKMIHFRVSKQGFPVVGGRYVMFLRQQTETQDYYLVTGYRLQGGRVAPLDGVGWGNRPLTTWFGKYDGAPESQLLADLRAAIEEDSK